MVSPKVISLLACSAILLYTVESIDIKRPSLDNSKRTFNPNNSALNGIEKRHDKKLNRRSGIEKRYKKEDQKDEWDEDEDEDEEEDCEDEENCEDEEDEEEDYDDDEDNEYTHQRHHHHWHKEKTPQFCEPEPSIFETTLTIHPTLDSTTTLPIPIESYISPVVGPGGGLELIEDGVEQVCYTDTILNDQLVYLKHFNGFFGSFIANGGSTDGPIAAKNITTTNFYFNSLGTNEDYCQAAIEVNRYGVVADYVDIGISVNGAIAANSGSIDSVIHPSDCRYDIGADDHLWKNVTGLFSGVFMDISESFRSRDANIIFNEDTSLETIFTESFSIFKLSPCSDDLCHNPIDAESVNNILKGGDDWSGPLDSTYDTDRPTLINVPVFVNRNYTITSKNVNTGGGGLSPCYTVFHFYPVDEAGDYVADGTFNIIRGDDVEINGLIFAPQGNIYDASTGSFGGQVITLQTFYGQGSSIRSYQSVDDTCDIQKSACWPPTILEEIDYPYVITTITLSSSVFDGTSTYSSVRTQYVDYFTNSIVDYETIQTTSYLVDTTQTTSTVAVTATEAAVVTVLDQVAKVRVMGNVERVTAESTITYTQTSTKTRYTSTSTSTFVATAQGTADATLTDTVTSTNPYAPAQKETAMAVASLIFNQQND